MSCSAARAAQQPRRAQPARREQQRDGRHREQQRDKQPGAKPGRHHLVLLYAWVGEHAAALRQYLECARVLDQDLGVRQLLQARLASAGETEQQLLHAAGQSAAAMSHLKQAVTIFAEIGAQVGALQPEIWKLAEW